MKSVPKWIACLGICFGTGLLGGLITKSGMPGWYDQLLKPMNFPPAWVFAPVWNVLYFLLAITLYLLWINEDGRYKSLALKAFFIQLLINLIWSGVFFGLHSIAGGLVVIMILLLAIICLAVFSWQVSSKAACLLAPYLGWVCFAWYLNYQLWLLNS